VRTTRWLRLAEFIGFGLNGSSVVEVNSGFDANHHVGFVFADDNGDLYVASVSFDAEINRSTDNGATFTPVFTRAAINGFTYGATQIQKHNGIYSFYIVSKRLEQTTNFVTYTFIHNPFPYDWTTYQFAGNNAVVAGGIIGINYCLP